MNPSVSTLWGLVTVLGLTMSDLFSEVEEAQRPPSALPAAPPGPLTADGTRAVVNLASGVRWERLTAESDPLVEFLFVVYPVGASSCDEDSLVRHGGKEYGYVIRGRLGVRIGFDEYELAPGHGALLRLVGTAPPVGDRRRGRRGDLGRRGQAERRSRPPDLIRRASPP